MTDLTLADLTAVVKQMPPVPTRAVCGIRAYRLIDKALRVFDSLPDIFGMRVIADATLPENVVELRDRDGKVLARHVLSGG